MWVGGELFIIILIIFLCIILSIGFLYFQIRKDVRGVFKSLFGVKSISQVIRQQDLEYQNTPKSVFGMESSYLPMIRRDFPDLNIAELKSIAEGYIIRYLNCLETGNIENMENCSDKMISLISDRIEDLKNKNINYDYVKTHRTVINRYDKSDSIATIKFQTSVEYMHREGNTEYKKIQDRFTTEFVYIIDVEQVHSSSKSLGLNCPNCGAPIKSIGEKHCVYCGSGIKDIVKRVWILNNISQG